MDIDQVYRELKQETERQKEAMANALLLVAEMVADGAVVTK